MKKSTTQKPLTDRQRTFARHVAEGMPACHAYQAAGYRSTDAAARANSSKLLSNAMVTAEVARLRKDADTAADMTRDELVAFLANAIRTPIANIDETSPLAQEVTRDHLVRKDTAEVTRVRIKSVGKLDAAKQLVAICGWAAPEKIEHSGTISLAAVLAEIAAEPFRLPCQQEA